MNGDVIGIGSIRDFSVYSNSIGECDGVEREQKCVDAFREAGKEDLILAKDVSEFGVTANPSFLVTFY